MRYTMWPPSFQTTKKPGFYAEKLGFPVLRENYREDPYTQRKMTFFHDPDGLPLELHE